VLLDKPAGVTSFEALTAVKRALRTGRVGHAGTLDRFATGLLVVLCGSCTRLVRFVHGLDKTYLARAELGRETDTLDPEGDVTAEAPLPSREQIEAALPAFQGSITQVPPSYSALHIGGRRAHELARAGEEPEMRSRAVHVHELEILAYEPPHLDLRVRCSTGTYVRSLARDIGRAADSCAHLVTLRRSSIGSIDVAESVTPSNFDPSRDLLEAGAFFSRHGVLPTFSLVPEAVGRVARGQGGRIETLFAGPVEDGDVACLDPQGHLVAVGVVAAGELRGIGIVQPRR
jgi:tRNA pseudouridine55 synthase